MAEPHLLVSLRAAPDPLAVDDNFVVVDKPAGWLAVHGRGPDKQDCLLARLQSRWSDVLTVHRLDQATSGLMVFARGAAAQRVLSRAFESRVVHKAYVACVAGLVSRDSGEIDLPLAADWPNRPRQQVDTKNGRPSLTRFEVLARDASLNSTRLRLLPHTGRTHQLRVHLAAIGHPVLGDTLYADVAAAAASPRLLLHASELSFPHPVNAQPLSFTSAPPF